MQFLVPFAAEERVVGGLALAAAGVFLVFLFTVALHIACLGGNSCIRR